MAYETITAMIDGIAGQNETRDLILRQAMDRSVLQVIAPGRRLTSPVVRGAFAGEVEAYAVAEGATKTTASGLMNTVSYSVKPIAIIVPVSNLVYEGETDVARGLIDQMTAGIARGIDRTILRDTESVFGYSVIGKATTASNVVTASGTTITYTNVSDTFAMVEADGFSVTGAIAREADKGAFRLAQTTNGDRWFVPADRSEPANLFGVPAGFVKSAGTLPVLPATAAGSETALVVGDWSQVHWGIYGDIQIKADPYTLMDKNQTRVLVELYLGFAVLNGNAFAILKEQA